MSPSARSRSSAVYSVPGRSRTRPAEMLSTSATIAYPCRLPAASAVRIRNVASCMLRRLTLDSIYRSAMHVRRLIRSDEPPPEGRPLGGRGFRPAPHARGGARADHVDHDLDHPPQLR